MSVSKKLHRSTNYNFLNLYPMLDKFSVTMFLAYVGKQLPQALWRLLDAEGPCIISFHSISCCRPQSWTGKMLFDLNCGSALNQSSETSSSSVNYRRLDWPNQINEFSILNKWSCQRNVAILTRLLLNISIAQYIFGYRKREKVGTKMIINLPVIRNL